MYVVCEGLPAGEIAAARKRAEFALHETGERPGVGALGRLREEVVQVIAKKIRDDTSLRAARSDVIGRQFM